MSYRPEWNVPLIPAAMGGALASALSATLLFAILWFPMLLWDGLSLAIIAFFVALIVALPHAVAAIPIYLLLRLQWRVTRFGAALCGFAIGATPAILGLYGDLVRDVGPLAFFGACGAIGGLAFGHILKRLEVREDL